MYKVTPKHSLYLHSIRNPVFTEKHTFQLWPYLFILEDLYAFSPSYSSKSARDTIEMLLWPIIGMLPSLLQNMSNIHNYANLILKHHGGSLWFGRPSFTNTSFILTSDPMNVHYITSKNFGNYGKGPHFIEIFEVFGDGIFNADFHAWKQERTRLLSLLKRKKAL